MNPLLESLPKIEIFGTQAIDASQCQIIWNQAGSQAEHFSGFLELYPAGFYVAWIRQEIGRWYAEKLILGNDEKIKLLSYGLAGGKTDSGIRQVVADFEIFLDVQRFVDRGFKLISPYYEDSVFLKLEKLKKTTWKKFFKKPIKAATIMDRYYRFFNFWMKEEDNYSFRNAMFFDNGLLIFGPTLIEHEGRKGFGFWQHKPETGFLRYDLLFFLPE